MASSSLFLIGSASLGLCIAACATNSEQHALQAKLEDLNREQISLRRRIYELEQQVLLTTAAWRAPEEERVKEAGQTSHGTHSVKQPVAPQAAPRSASHYADLDKKPYTNSARLPDPFQKPQSSGVPQPEPAATLYRIDGPRGSAKIWTSTAASANQSVAIKPVESQEFDAAFELYKNGQFAEAAHAFAKFRAAFPEHSMADNALYWRGESMFALGEFGEALALFKRLMQQHPHTEKRLDAYYKIGLCSYKIGEVRQGKLILTQIARVFPKTKLGRVARHKLAEM